jgi:hypothetical protein
MNIMMRLLLVIPLLAFAAGCSTVRATSEYNTDIEFAHFHAYAWLAPPDESDTKSPVADYAREMVDEGLKAKGYAPDDESPDFLIALHVGAGKSIDVSTWGYAYGAKPYYHDFHVPHEGTPRDHIDFEYIFDMKRHTYSVGTLIVDFIHGETREMVWRGAATSVVEPSLPPEEIRMRILTGVTEILGNFPPY